MKSVIHVDLAQMRWFRLRRAGLVVPFATPELAAQQLAGIQAQIHPAAGLSLFNRTSALTHAQFDRLLFEDRSLVKLWGQRGTLHVYASADWPLICGMLAERKSWWARTAEKTDTYDAYAATALRVEQLLRERQVLGRSDLRAAGFIEHEEHLSPWGGIFAELVREGYACHAARDGEGLFAHRLAWLPDLAWEPPDRDAANLEMLRRYLHAYGPASFQDYAYWLGGRRTSRSWWAAIEPETVRVSVEGVEMQLPAEDVDDLLAPADELRQSVRMLYRFDPLLLAHKDKRWIVPAEAHKRVFRIAGHIEGVVLDGGYAVATWRYTRKASGLAVTLEPFKRLPARVRRAVEKQSHRIASFFGLALTGITDA